MTARIEGTGHPLSVCLIQSSLSLLDRTPAGAGPTEDACMFLDLEFITMVLWTIGLGALGAAVAGIMVANTDWFLSKPEKATLEYLQNAELKSIEEEMDQRSFRAAELWQNTGAVVMAVRRPG
ncbi:hypothetical protein NDU88_010120 [Pleurodeles waltl]|uniref:Redox-regulatory protein FAM213A n=3 Tax=Pleurodeles waltl TaxID=8319 RepID=A0AAV7QTG9_PLEWA|nr:hypothetical protein NDU88_010120 [Pleurodeles waltl]